MADHLIEDLEAEYPSDQIKEIKADDLKQARLKIMDMLNSDELTKEAKDSLRAMLGANMPFMSEVDNATGPWLAVVLAVLLFSVILFFGYKLYKSIKEKEIKREEKKKAKQMKKKK